ncbi:hypothetical protein, partial [Streptococcus pneumoniae]|uniref:hypothetical protein n=1 Tax=Streptococcus pneumoniae TaxID=1313 RepID=UPI0018B0A347
VIQSANAEEETFATKLFGKLVSKSNDSPTADKLFGEKDEIRVKSMRERYGYERKALYFPTVTKSGLAHPKGGQPVIYMNRPMQTT